MNTHIVIDLSSRKNDLRMISETLRFVRQIIRIDPNTMTSNQSRLERQKVPFCSGCFKYFVCIDSDSFKDQRKFVHKCNVYIALRIFDYFGGLSDLER